MESKKIIGILILIAASVSPVYAITENFTLIFPFGIGTTTYITGHSVAEAQANSLIAVMIFAIIVLTLLFAVFGKKLLAKSS